MHRFHMEIFSLKNLYEIEGKEEYPVEISNRVRSFGKRKR
jgi:hypothetical protein